MSQFDDFDRFLNLSFGANEWEDDAAEHASELIAGFSSDDWASLRENWRTRTEIWQVRAAYVLSDGDPQEATSVLIQMIETGAENAVVEAAQSLESVAGRGGGARLSPQARARLVSLSNKRSGLVKKALLRAIEKL